MQTAMTEGLIGVIVPVYKVEKYIAECIESILAQTYTKFRLILVDDGTPDNAGKICDEYAKKDSRITVIHQENAGVTRARARGVEEASDCEWITFVDGDDTLPNEALEKLRMPCIENKNIDIVLGFRTEVKDGKDRVVYNSIGTGLYKPIEYINAMFIDDCILGPWAKIIKRELLTKESLCIPRKVVQYEDLYMNIITGYNAKYIYIDNSIHAYRHVEDSDTSQFIYNKYMQEEGWVILLSAIKTFLVKKNIFECVSRNFSRFAYLRIHIYNKYYKTRFKKCRELNLQTFNKSQQNILWSNLNYLYFHIFNVTQKIKSYLLKH